MAKVLKTVDFDTAQDLAESILALIKEHEGESYINGEDDCPLNLCIHEDGRRGERPDERQQGCGLPLAAAVANRPEGRSPRSP